MHRATHLAVTAAARTVWSGTCRCPAARGAAAASMQILSVERFPSAQVLASALARDHAALTVIPGLQAIAVAGSACVDVVVAEPFFFQMQNLVLWQCMNVWYTLGAMRKSGLVGDSTAIVPRRASIHAGRCHTAHGVDSSRNMPFLACLLSLPCCLVWFASRAHAWCGVAMAWCWGCAGTSTTLQLPSSSHTWRRTTERWATSVALTTRIWTRCKRVGSSTPFAIPCGCMT